MYFVLRFHLQMLIFVDFHYLLIGLAMVGKLCITAAYGVVYIMSAEIFPTVVRNAGMGSSSGVARVGSMIAPYIAKSVS
jgi:OCT family organic cation transporter-like MFS transporter 4/5